jgi:hypothetical protein
VGGGGCGLGYSGRRNSIQSYLWIFFLLLLTTVEDKYLNSIKFA